MARYRAEHKQEAREAILKHAAARFRTDGIAAVGVRTLMADAGLTHGGFYAHFASREDLVAATLEHAAQSTLAYFQNAVAKAPSPRKLAALIETYLQTLHWKHRNLGCAASALASEIARESEETRAKFQASNSQLIALIAANLPPGGDEQERLDRAAVIFATMMGTLQLARIETDEAMVERLLEGGRHSTLSLAALPWNHS